MGGGAYKITEAIGNPAEPEVQIKATDDKIAQETKNLERFFQDFEGISVKPVDINNLTKESQAKITNTVIANPGSYFFSFQAGRITVTTDKVALEKRIISIESDPNVVGKVIVETLQDGQSLVFTYALKPVDTQVTNAKDEIF